MEARAAVLNPVEEEDQIVPDNPTPVASRPKTRTSHAFNLTGEELVALRKTLAISIRKNEAGLESKKERLGARYVPGPIERRIGELRDLYFKFGGALEHLSRNRP